MLAIKMITFWSLNELYVLQGFHQIKKKNKKKTYLLTITTQKNIVELGITRKKMYIHYKNGHCILRFC